MIGKTIVFLLSALSLLATSMNTQVSSPTISPEERPIVWVELPGPGKKCPIDENTSFLYEFSEKPKLGTLILKIQVFDKDGRQITPFTISGRFDMPSMKGAHDSGDIELQLNRYGNYLLPLDIVMPGLWEVRLTFYRDQKPVLYGRLTFHV